VEPREGDPGDIEGMRSKGLGPVGLDTLFRVAGLM
jgi:hypothetical protein